MSNTPIIWLYFVVAIISVHSLASPAVLPPGPTSKKLKDASRTTPQLPRRAGRDAYVTLLYGGFLLGARVLGQSLKETDTKKDLIALCTDTVSKTTQKILQADGWIIKDITNIHSPYEGLSSRGDYFSGIFSKLHVWNMTEYERIIYLDSDVLVLTNIDHMFDCGTFCAAYRHSDFFNAGIIVVEPNATIFNDMLREIPALKSYDDGDQGFLNIYFKNLVYASFFNWSNSSRQRQPMRMPAGLNADIGNYYTNSRWIIPEQEIRVIHFTLGPLKPWIWWTNFLFDQNWKWTPVRMRLPQYPHHDDTFKPGYLPYFWAPYPILLLLWFGVKCIDCCRWYNKKYAVIVLKLFASLHARFSSFSPLVFLVMSYYMAYRFVVPTTMLPGQAEYVFWLWSNFFLFVLLGSYCYLTYVSNKIRGHFQYTQKKLKTLVLYVIFTVSYIFLKRLPPVVTPFSNRVSAFFVLLAFHALVSHFVGYWVIQIWTWIGNNIDSDSKISRSESTFSLKKESLE